MELLEAIKGRRSIRKFKAKIPPDELIKKCIEAACCAPSAHNSQPWKFVIVKDKEKISALSKTQTYATFLKNAPIVIVVLADEKASPHHWVEDCSCAAMLLMLRAHELGLGTCWSAVYQPKGTKREKYVLNTLKVSGYRVLANIGIGYPAEKLGRKEIKNFDEAVL